MFVFQFVLQKDHEMKLSDDTLVVDHLANTGMVTILIYVDSFWHLQSTLCDFMWVFHEDKVVSNISDAIY